MKKTLKDCYKAKKNVEFVVVPAIRYITYVGKGDPNISLEFQSSMEVLYGLAYTLKFQYKKMNKDFVVMPLEGQWWTDKPEEFSLDDKGIWNWKAMIAIPDFVTEESFIEAKKVLKEKKNPAGISNVSFEVITDGLSTQFLYIGPYNNEDPYIKEMHSYVKSNGYKLRGKHREIYLSNPQRVSPEKLKTIIRHPVEKVT